MGQKIRIAFDLDGVIIDKPPLISKKLLERLFRRGGKEGLHYQFPKSKLEQRIRKLSHFYLFRPPIKKNVEFIRNLAKNSKYELYIISGRYSFLEKETENWLEKRMIKDLFKGIFLNLEDEQPHLFKEEILKKIGAEVFVDDDYLLADYLTEKLKITKVLCYSPGESNLSKKAVDIKKIEELNSLFRL